MAITISITIPDEYVPQIRDAIDALDPLEGGETYQEKFKKLIRRWTKFYIQQSIIQARDIEIDDDVIS